MGSGPGGEPGGEPPGTATAMGGTHPTGMYSGFLDKIKLDLELCI